MAKIELTKSQKRAAKIESNIRDLAKLRTEIKDFDSISAALTDEGAKQKVSNIRARLNADASYLMESTVRQGYMMIVEANKVQAFVDALPVILK